MELNEKERYTLSNTIDRFIIIKNGLREIPCIVMSDYTWLTDKVVFGLELATYVKDNIDMLNYDEYYTLISVLGNIGEMIDKRMRTVKSYVDQTPL